MQMVQLSAIRCSCIAILWVSLVNFAAITLCVASQRVFIVVYFVIDSIREVLDITSHFLCMAPSWCNYPNNTCTTRKLKIKLSLCLTKHHAMKTYLGVEGQLHAFLTSALDGGEWSASRLCRFTPSERAPGTHWIGGWVGSRAFLDAVAKRKIPSPAENRTLEPRSSSPQCSAIPTELFEDYKLKSFLSGNSFHYSVNNSKCLRTDTCNSLQDSVKSNSRRLLRKWSTEPRPLACARHTSRHVRMLSCSSWSANRQVTAQSVPTKSRCTTIGPPSWFLKVKSCAVMNTSHFEDLYE
jgi:hypothetical protein